MGAIPHPLSSLSAAETNLARDLVAEYQTDAVLDFRQTFLLEPKKAEVLAFLDTEHGAGITADTPRPPRLAQVRYDAVGKDKVPTYQEAVIDLREGKVLENKIVSTADHHASLTIYEFETLVKVCEKSDVVQAKIAEMKLPEGFQVVIEPWPYGASEIHDGRQRFFQALIFAQDTRSGNPDANFYAYPLPIIPIMDAVEKKIVRIEQYATGGKGDSLFSTGIPKNPVDHCKTSEYVPELLPNGPRTDLKPLHITQPEGPSFDVTDGNLVKWQKWSMRLTFNPREGAVLHDIRYDGRSIMYRLSISEMTVPYADPRPPFHRKQAFDLGDGAFGNTVNSLTLGCDCLGLIKYFDGVLTDAKGGAVETKNVICMHEQDDGVGWKHLNWRTGRSVVARKRDLVIQFSVTLANYDYIFAFKFDQAAGITVEARATGIVSVVNIDAGKKSDWGKVVSPGALAQNHQHIFCVRMDPAIDGVKNRLVQEESLPLRMDKRTNPQGNLYEVKQTVIATSVGLDADPWKHRIFKIQNADKINPITGTPVSYKINPPASQLLLADPQSVQYKRAAFATKHLWATKFKDDELYAGGRYPLQSRVEVGGVSDAAARSDDILDEDIVLWSCFGLTHNPRAEDWPVMPCEKLELHIMPSDFFTENPAIDVPSGKDSVSQNVVVTNGCKKC